MAQVVPADIAEGVAKAAQWSDASLASLENVANLHIEQRVNMLEALADAVGYSCCAQKNVYDVYDGGAPPADRQRPGDAGHLFLIQETGKGCKDMCCRACFNPFHEMTLSVSDAKTKAAVFNIERPFRWCGCAWCPCPQCQQEWNVMAASSTEAFPVQLGAVKQPCCGGGCFPKFHLFDGPPDEEAGGYPAVPLYWITGPHFIGELCCDVKFDVKDPNVLNEEGKATVVGEITKLGATDLAEGITELLTDADKFQFTIPVQASVTAKAVAITGMVLLDYYFFESGGAIECNPSAGPGQPYLTINCCTEFCCGHLYPWKVSFSKGSGV